MIRTESFTVSRETFATGRKDILTRTDDTLRPHIKEALGRIGLPSWEMQIVNAALDVFDTTARAEVDEWGQVIDDMRDLFALELQNALQLTKKSATPDAQLEAITSWVSAMSVNAGTEAATTADPDPEVGLEWITMSDKNVREPHKDAHGQTVPTGQAFEVGKVKMMYPGQPVGDPENWIRCRCVARPTMLTEASAKAESFGTHFNTSLSEEYKARLLEAYPQATHPMLYTTTDVSRETLTAAGEAEPEEKQVFTSATIMALPADADPISAASSEADGAHCTLLFLGDLDVLDRAALVSDLEAFITGGAVTPFTDKVSGRATLGEKKAEVVLLDGANITAIRTGLLEKDYLRASYEAIEQFPNFIPHVTLGYPETPATGEFAGDAVTFDRIALWFGEDRSAVFQLGEPMPAEKKVIHPEDPGFTQEMADEFVASVPEKEPAAPAPAAAAPAAPAAEEQLRPWHGVLAPEGAPSGDKRGFAAKMLTMRDLPLPLKAQFVDDEGHKGSVIVGRIDEVYRDGGLIKAAGVWDNSPEAEKAWGMIDRKMWRGVSVDLDAAEGEMVEAAEEGGQPSVEFTQGRVCSSTLCAIPAFAEAFIRNGTWAEFANEPLPSGAMVEIPDWVHAEKTPALSLVASGAPAINADFFRNPLLTEPTAVTRGEDGLIFGHLGIWDACHIAYEVCTTVPPSETDYAYFLTGQVFTDAGPVAVGQLTVGGGHADGKLGVRAAIAHYDNVASAVADITVGEDEFGVWFSGRIRPWATEKQIHEMFAAGPSGDWRGVRFRGSDTMELVAAHAVNVQGFPVPRKRRARFTMEGTRQVSLVAAGMLAPAAIEQGELVSAVNEVKASIRAMRFADMKKQFTSMKGK